MAPLFPSRAVIAGGRGSGCAAALLLLGMALWACGCAGGPALARFEFTRVCMGVPARIVVYAPDEERAVDAAGAAYDRIGELDASMSDYRVDSELNRVNSQAGGKPVLVSRDLYEVLRESVRIAAGSEGAFDPTVGPCVALWRTSRRNGTLAPAAELERARELVDWRKVELDGGARTCRLGVPGMRMDLGGIAKGYAAEEAVKVMAARGYPACLAALAGDIAVGDAPPGRAGWAVSIANVPAKDGTLVLEHRSVSTSGDAEQFVTIEGRRFAHIVDPRTGLGASEHRQVSVIARSGAWADGLSTAAFLMDSGRTRAMLRQFPGTSAVFVKDGVVTTAGEPVRLGSP